jgi:hypothetical protein
MVRFGVGITVVALASCGYGPSFSDNTITCNVNSGCPGGYTCCYTSSPSEGLCRSGETSGSCPADAGGDAPKDGPGNDGPKDGPGIDAAAIQIRPVQQGTASNPSSLTLVVTMPAASTTGDTLIAAISTDSNITSVVSVSGGGVGTWQQIVAVAGTNGGVCDPPATGCIRGALWWGTVGAAGGQNVTLTFSGTADNLGASITEWSGIATLDTFTKAGPTKDSSAVSSGMVTTTLPNELVFAMGAWDNASTPSTPGPPTNGFTELLDATGTSYAAPAYLIASAPGMESTGWTLSAQTKQWIGIAAAFKPM